MDSLYSSVFQSLPGLVCLLDSDRVIVNANPAFVETQNEECVGRKFEEFLPRTTDRPYFVHTLSQNKAAHHQLDDTEFQTAVGLMLS